MERSISKVLKSDKNLASFRVLDTYENQTVPKISLVQKYDYFEAKPFLDKKSYFWRSLQTKRFEREQNLNSVF